MATRQRAAQHLLADGNDLRVIRNTNIFGAACTAALVSASPKKGPHRVHVATCRQGQAHVFNIELQKGHRDRAGEDAVCSSLILDAIHALTAEQDGVGGSSSFSSSSSSSAGVDFPFSQSMLLHEHEVVSSERIPLTDVFDNIYSKKTRQAMFVLNKKKEQEEQQQQSTKEEGGEPGTAATTMSPSLTDNCAFLEDVPLPVGTVVFPGSFNPLHEGHVTLVVAALKQIEENAAARKEQEQSGDGNESSKASSSSSSTSSLPSSLHRPVVFEIAAVNADKPPLPREEIIARIHALLSSPLLEQAGLMNVAVCITSEPLFLEKSSLFKGCNFVIGADTLSRLINPKYYGGSMSSSLSPDVQQQQREQAMVSALSVIAERECKIIVGGRRQTDASKALAAAAAAAASAGKKKGSEEEAEVEVEPVFETFETILLSGTGPKLPSRILEMFQGISEENFRIDLSSTDVRKRLALAQAQTQTQTQTQASARVNVDVSAK